MFEARQRRGLVGSAGSLLWLIHHNTVRTVRRSHRNAILSIGTNILQTVIMVGVFYVMFSLLGLRGMAIRGDFLLYIMSGIFLFMAHIKAMAAVVASEGPASPMMQHLPMNTTVAIAAAALSSLYISTLSMMLILSVYHLGWGPIEIYDPVGAYAMVLLAWFSGVSIGMVFLALKPWFPGFVGIASQLFQRANMFASGKMFIANTLPATMLAMFDWNPLFHAIDQARGFMFVNYNPHFSEIAYPIYVSVVCLVIGLMGESYTRKHASISWSAGR
ncbi:MAG: ABC transporter permease [Pseudomonadota bacterium]